jgi:hypothetical protein
MNDMYQKQNESELMRYQFMLTASREIWKPNKLSKMKQHDEADDVRAWYGRERRQSCCDVVK